MKTKVDGALSVQCARAGCVGRLSISYERLRRETDDMDSGNLDRALTAIALEAGWTPALVCPNHLDVGGKVATFDPNARTVTLVLDAEEAREYVGRTFRVTVDPQGEGGA